MAISWVELFAVFHVDEAVELVNGSLEFSVVFFPLFGEGEQLGLLLFELLELLLLGLFGFLDCQLVLVEKISELDGRLLLLMRFFVMMVVSLVKLDHLIDSTDLNSVTLGI